MNFSKFDAHFHQKAELESPLVSSQIDPGGAVRAAPGCEDGWGCGGDSGAASVGVVWPGAPQPWEEKWKETTVVLSSPYTVLQRTDDNQRWPRMCCVTYEPIIQKSLHINLRDYK